MPDDSIPACPGPAQPMYQCKCHFCEKLFVAASKWEGICQDCKLRVDAQKQSLRKLLGDDAFAEQAAWSISGRDKLPGWDKRDQLRNEAIKAYRTALLKKMEEEPAPEQGEEGECQSKA